MFAYLYDMTWLLTRRRQRKRKRCHPTHVQPLCLKILSRSEVTTLVIAQNFLVHTLFLFYFPTRGHFLLPHYKWVNLQHPTNACERVCAQSGEILKQLHSCDLTACDVMMTWVGHHDLLFQHDVRWPWVFQYPRQHTTTEIKIIVYVFLSFFMVIHKPLRCHLILSTALQERYVCPVFCPCWSPGKLHVWVLQMSRRNTVMASYRTV